MKSGSSTVILLIFLLSCYTALGQIDEQNEEIPLKKNTFLLGGGSSVIYSDASINYERSFWQSKNEKLNLRGDIGIGFFGVFWGVDLGTFTNFNISFLYGKKRAKLEYGFGGSYFFLEGKKFLEFDDSDYPFPFIPRGHIGLRIIDRKGFTARIVLSYPHGVRFGIGYSF